MPATATSSGLTAICRICLGAFPFTEEYFLRNYKSEGRLVRNCLPCHRKRARDGWHKRIKDRALVAELQELDPKWVAGWTPSPTVGTYPQRYWTALAIYCLATNRGCVDCPARHCETLTCKMPASVQQLLNAGEKVDSLAVQHAREEFAWALP